MGIKMMTLHTLESRLVQIKILDLKNKSKFNNNFDLFFKSKIFICTNLDFTEVQ